ncbi:MAG: HAMP domain-containing histidine kinase [Verrucomicrobia bacterium]|nr:HAMP domain-containing histidine kinase [Verrucomicrobiota bacterium]
MSALLNSGPLPGANVAGEVVQRWWGLHFADPDRERSFLRDLLLQGFARNRVTIAVCLVVVLVSGGMGHFLIDDPAARAGWIRAMSVRCALLLPIWGGALLLAWQPALLLRVGVWAASGVPLTVLSFSLELAWGGSEVSEMRLLYPALVFLAAGVLFSWASRVLLWVTAASLVAGPISYVWLAGPLRPAAHWNVWGVWFCVVIFLLIGSRRRELAERELFLHREAQERLVAELRVANDDLRQLNRLRTEFLTLAAHDLRNPLTVVLGNAAALADGTLRPETAEGREALGELVTSGEHMRDIVQRFLEEPARKAPEGSALALRPQAVGTLFESVVLHTQPTLRRKAQTLEVAPPPAGLGVRADFSLLVQALENLVSNASKFSPVGGRIRLEAAPSADRALTRLAVVDQGPGLSAEDQAALFQRGRRLSARPTAGEPSAGVGLSLVKSWVELMGGKVGCDSEAGQGACFWIELPHATVTPPGGRALRQV